MNSTKGTQPVIREKQNIKTLQKAGGFAALIHAAGYTVGIILAFTLIAPALSAAPAEYMAFVSNNQLLMSLWILSAYWVSAAALVVMVLAIYEYLKDNSPALMQVATIFGLIWAGLIIGSGNLMIHDFGVIANLFGEDPIQAETVLLAMKAVENGIVSGNELVGSLWVLLLSLAALRTKGLPKGLNYLGIILSVAGILTLIPAIPTYIFGLGMIVWSIWLGVALLRKPASQE
jgi:hypothetical protein